MSPFKAFFSYKPPLLPVLLGPTSVAVVDEHLQQRQQVIQQLKKDLAMAQNWTKELADTWRSEREFDVGEEVYLKCGPISLLSPRYFGLFPIVAKIGSVAYKLQLSEGTQIHSVFHVSLLKKAVRGQ